VRHDRGSVLLTPSVLSMGVLIGTMLLA